MAVICHNSALEAANELATVFRLEVEEDTRKPLTNPRDFIIDDAIPQALRNPEGKAALKSLLDDT